MAGNTGPKTMLEAFEDPLPKHRSFLNGEYASVGAVDTVEEDDEAVAPLILLCGQVEPLLDKADEILRHAEINKWPRLLAPAPSEGCLSNLISEGDVAMASLIFMLKDIFEILNGIYPGKWQYRGVGSQSNLMKAYDGIFYAPEDDGKPGKTIAIIQYRKKNTIKYQDYERGLLANNGSSLEIDQAKQNAMVSSPFAYNAEVYLKQSSHYAKSRECAHVALFNWDHLLMLNFDNEGTDKSFTTGSQAELIWACEDALESKFMHQCAIRKAMFGWLLCTFSDHFR